MRRLVYTTAVPFFLFLILAPFHVIAQETGIEGEEIIGKRTNTSRTYLLKKGGFVTVMQVETPSNVPYFGDWGYYYGSVKKNLSTNVITEESGDWFGVIGKPGYSGIYYDLRTYIEWNITTLPIGITITNGRINMDDIDAVINPGFSVTMDIAGYSYRTNPIAEQRYNDIGGGSIYVSVGFTGGNNQHYYFTNNSDFINSLINVYNQSATPKMICLGYKGTDAGYIYLNGPWNLLIYYNDDMPPEISNITPSEGSELVVGNVYTSTWTASDNVGISYFKIELTTNGIDWTLLNNVPGNLRCLSWTVPNNASTNCKLRVTAYDYNTPQPNSTIAYSGLFTIKNQDNLVLQNHTAGGSESYAARYTITAAGLDGSGNPTYFEITSPHGHVDFLAGATIYLKPGFHAYDGSFLKASIGSVSKGSPLALGEGDEAVMAEGRAPAESDGSCQEALTGGWRSFPGQRPAVPERTFLEMAYPNPFSSSTDINYNMKNGGNVALTVYNVAGQKIRELVNSYRPAGYHTITWDGTNDNGQRVSKGVYLCSFSSSGINQCTRLIILR